MGGSQHRAGWPRGVWAGGRLSAEGRKWPAAMSSWEGNEEAESTGVADLKVSCVGLKKITGGPEQSESEEEKT